MAKKALVVVTSAERLESGKDGGFWLADVTHFVHVLKAAGYGIDFVSTRGGYAPVEAKSKNDKDPLNREFAADRGLFAKLRNTRYATQVDAADYACVYVAGGSGAMVDLPVDEALATLIGKIYDDGGVVAAVGQGVGALTRVTLADGTALVAGKSVTAAKARAPFDLEASLRERGADFSKKLLGAHVVVSERLVTGQNSQSAKRVAEAVAQQLEQASRQAA